MSNSVKKAKDLINSDDTLETIIDRVIESTARRHGQRFTPEMVLYFVSVVMTDCIEEGMKGFKTIPVPKFGRFMIKKKRKSFERNEKGVIFVEETKKPKTFLFGNLESEVTWLTRDKGHKSESGVRVTDNE